MTKGSGKKTPPSHEKDGGARLDLAAYFPYRLAVLAKHVALAVADVYAKRFALSRQEWRVIAAMGGAARIATRDIGRVTTLDKMEISRAMSRLEARGLIARSPDDTDRRNKIVMMTPAGRALYEQIVPLALEREAALLNTLDDAERVAFERTMEKLATAAGKLHK